MQSFEQSYSRSFQQKLEHSEGNSMSVHCILSGDAPIYETFTIKSYYESETPFSDDDMNNLPESMSSTWLKSSNIKFRGCYKCRHFSSS